MRVAKRRCVGNHDAGITVLPESPLIGPRDARDKRRKRRAFGWNSCMFPEEGDGAAQQRTRMNVADKSDEVTNRRIKRAEPNRWIGLRTRRVGKIPDRFQTDHGGNLIVASFAPARVDKTSHLRCLEVGRFFIYKRDEA